MQACVSPHIHSERSLLIVVAACWILSTRTKQKEMVNGSVFVLLCAIVTATTIAAAAVAAAQAAATISRHRTEPCTSGLCTHANRSYDSRVHTRSVRVVFIPLVRVFVRLCASVCVYGARWSVFESSIYVLLIVFVIRIVMPPLKK